MKILLVSYWVLPHVGGVWTYMEGLKRGLEDLGHEVDILTRHPDDKHYYIMTQNRYVEKSTITESVRQQVQSFYKQHLPHIGDWTIKQEVERNSFEMAALYFGLKDYDLIHTQDVISTRALWRVKPKDTPLVATIHGCLAAEYLVFLGVTTPPYDSVWDYTVAREYYGSTSSDLTIVPTSWLQNMLNKEYFVPDEHLTVIPYGLHIENFQSRMEQGTEIVRPSNKKILICPARLEVVKGHKYLLDALAMLKHDRTDWVCWLIGDGSERHKLEIQCEQLKLKSHVIFMGDREDVPALLNLADILVLPSINDNQPYALMEAQIAGKAVVVSNAGGIPEMVIHNENGLICAAAQSVPLYQNLKRVLTSDTLRQQLSCNAKRWANEQWPLHKMVDRTFSIYEKVLRDKRKDR